MFDNSFSISIIFPQVQMCQQACTLKQKCSRRNEKSKKHTTLTPKMMKNDKNRKCWIFFLNPPPKKKQPSRCQIVSLFGLEKFISLKKDAWNLKNWIRKHVKIEKESQNIIYENSLKTIFYTIPTLWHVLGRRKLYELSRRKPGWRFTAGLEFFFNLVWFKLSRARLIHYER